MSTEMLPLFWRVAGCDRNGVKAVSLLMPSAQTGQAPAEFPVDVFFHSSRSEPDSVDLRWSDEDSDLFMNLLDRVVDMEEESSVTLDITDGVVQGIVQLVALARFRTPKTVNDLGGRDLITELEENEIGDLVAINTCYGFALAIIVGMDAIDATCILLESVSKDEAVVLADHSLVMVNRGLLLPCSFADSDTGNSSTLH